MPEKRHVGREVVLQYIHGRRKEKRVMQQAATPDLLQVTHISDQAKARLRGKGVRVPPSEP